MFDPAKQGFGCTPDFVQAWSDLAMRTMLATTGFRPESSPLEAGREIRRGPLQNLGRGVGPVCAHARVPQRDADVDGDGRQWRKVWMDFFSYWQQNFVGA